MFWVTSNGKARQAPKYSNKNTDVQVSTKAEKREKDETGTIITFEC